MWGIIYSIISGFAMSVQGVFNTQLSRKIGLWETTFLIQGIAFITAFIIMLIFGNGNIRNLKYANKLYLFAGILGVIITFTVIKGMSLLGPALSVAVILISQLITAALISHFGLFGSPVIALGLRQCIGVVIMIAGIVIFKWKG